MTSSATWDGPLVTGGADRVFPRVRRLDRDTGRPGLTERQVNSVEEVLKYMKEVRWTRWNDDDDDDV